MPENPWKTLSSAEIYTNPWFSVREDQVIAPHGTAEIYHVVAAGRIAVGIVPLWPDGTITLVGQYRYPVKQYSWEIPEGGGDFGIDPLDSAKRELQEETGIIAEDWTYLGKTHTSNCFLDEVGHLYLASGLTQGRSNPGPEELLRVERVPIEEAVAMIKGGRITDAITIVAICHVLTRSNVMWDRLRHLSSEVPNGSADHTTA